jgi:hypothetical protein
LEPWLSEQLVSYHVPYDVTCNVLGVVTEEDKHYERLKLISLTPGSPAERHLANKNVLGYYILMMNGVHIRLVSDIRLILHDYHEHDEVRGPAYLTGITILFGALQPNAPKPEQIEFSEQDHATARVVWSIIATASNEQSEWQSPTTGMIPEIIATEGTIHRALVDGGGTDPRLADIEMRKALLPPPEDDTIAFVRSIIVSAIHLGTDIP